MSAVAPRTGLWRLVIAADAQSEPAFSAALEDEALALSAFEVEGSATWRIEALLPAPPGPAIEARLALAAAGLGRAAPATMLEELPETDWLAQNRRAFPAFRVARYHLRGTHITEPPPPATVPIVLDAGIAFGTGEHESTRGCLLALDRLARRRRCRRVLDLGCGSGILAIAAAKTWHTRVCAVDLDAAAVRTARDNAKDNGVGGWVSVRPGNGRTRATGGRRFDLIFANILARPLERLARALKPRLAPGGVLVLSGLLDAQAARVHRAYSRQHLVPIGRRSGQGWTTLTLRRPKNIGT